MVLSRDLPGGKNTKKTEPPSYDQHSITTTTGFQEAVLAHIKKDAGKITEAFTIWAIEPPPIA